MTINIATPRRVRIAEEANNAFGVDLTGTLASFLDCPAVEATFEAVLDKPTESPGYTLQHLDAHPLEVLMPRTASAKFKIGLETIGTAAGNGVAAVQGAVGRLLKICMGGEALGTGTTIQSTSTTTVLNCTSATNIAVGSAVACATGPGGLLEYREVKSKSGNAVTLKHALSSIPANGSVVYSCATYYLHGTSGDQTTYLQLIVEGLYSGDRYLLRGGWLDSLSIELGPAQRPMLSFAWKFADWRQADGTQTVANLVGAGVLGFASYANNTTIVLADSEFRQQTVNTSTIGPIIDANAIEYAPQIKFTTARAPGGLNTFKQAIRDSVHPVITGSFTCPLEDNTWLDAHANQTAKAFWLQIGMTASKRGILLSAPTTQVKDVQTASVDGVINQKVNWIGRLDEGTSGDTSNLARSAARVHLF